MGDTVGESNIPGEKPVGQWVSKQVRWLWVVARKVGKERRRVEARRRLFLLASDCLRMQESGCLECVCE
jgi:hypothetical protein